MPIRSLFVANRGEIALRIIRSARELGIKTILGHSAADAESLPVRLADTAIEIGPGPAAKSYLNAERVVRLASESGADAIHPGYGFLAENADFVDGVERAGLTFVGPSAESIRLMGDKAKAREIAREVGIATVPGSEGTLSGLEEAQALAEKVGYPVMIKAVSGGGGKGIRTVCNPTELAKDLPQAQAEAKAAFGDGGVYLEKVIQGARHLEVQLLGDGFDVIHLHERDCSLQRRRQKIWEEAPATGLPASVMEKLHKTAVELARRVNYRSAGTIEFLYDPDRAEFYFIEMNTRIQVEHPTTELVAGLDLVGEMLRISGGERLRFRQDEIDIRGHAIEVRLNAEDPDRQFLPQPGVIEDVRVPGGLGVRFDSHIFPGYRIPPFYDSLIGKLIVLGDNRSHALDRLQRALHELSITGVKTTAGLFEDLVSSPEVRSGDYHTKWLEPWLAARGR